MTKSTITREPITHDLKIYPELFSAVCTGVKRAELRKNDRDYRVGDTLHLMETPRGSCHQTGEFINVKITDITDVDEWMPGYVLLSIEREALDSESVILYRERNPYNGLTTGWQELTENELSFLKENAGENAEFLKLYRHAQPAPVVPDDVSGPLAHAYKELTPTFMRNHIAVFERYGIAPNDSSTVIQALRIALDGIERRAAMLQAEPVTTANKLGNSPVIPDGYVMVPKVLTEEMIAAAMNCEDVLFFNDGSFCVQFGNIYDAMLAAAPQEVKLLQYLA